MSSAKLPLAPVVERCTSKPLSLLELSCQETSIRLFDTTTALGLDGAAGGEPPRRGRGGPPDRGLLAGEPGERERPCGAPRGPRGEGEGCGPRGERGGWGRRGEVVGRRI